MGAFCGGLLSLEAGFQHESSVALNAKKHDALKISFILSPKIHRKVNL